MEFEQIIQLIDHISDSKLTSFQYEGENIHLSMKCEKETMLLPTFIICYIGIILGDVIIYSVGRFFGPHSRPGL